jgi:hypothetical protein
VAISGSLCDLSFKGGITTTCTHNDGSEVVWSCCSRGGVVVGVADGGRGTYWCSNGGCACAIGMHVCALPEPPCVIRALSQSFYSMGIITGVMQYYTTVAIVACGCAISVGGC